MKNALHGVKILDLSRVFAGPHGSMILADFGAEVIRIEHPKRMDDMRYWSPFVGKESTYFLCANRNKQSITLDLKSKKGKEILAKLIEEADVVIENFKVGTFERLGFGYKRLKEIKEDIILCSVTGYGQTGPYSENPGYDPVIQAIGGLMAVTGEPGGEGTRVGVPVVDIMTSLYVAISVMSALRMKELNGVGQHVDISLLDVQVSSLANVASSYLMTGNISKAAGNRHENITPYETFPCADKQVMIAAGNDQLYNQLCQAIQRPELASDPRFVTNAKRVEHREELRAILEKVFVEKAAAEWEQLMIQYEVPCGPVNTVDQVFEHPQVKHRNMIQEKEHPTLGKVRMVRNPIRFSGIDLNVETYPPLHGEHTEKILKERLGLADEELRQLRDEGVI